MGCLKQFAHALDGFAAHGGVEQLIRSGFQVDVVNRVADSERGVGRARRVNLGAAIDAQADAGMTVDEIQNVFFFQQTGFPVGSNPCIMPHFCKLCAASPRDG